MFIGMHGKDSAFVVVPRNAPDLHLPTDLLGHTPATYDPDRAKSRSQLQPTLGPVATKIKTAIHSSRWTKLKPVIEATSRPHAGAIKYPLKLWLEITNNSQYPIAIESLSFDLDRDLKLAPNAKAVLGDRSRFIPQYRYLITKGPDNTNVEHFSTRCLIPSGETFISYVPIEPTVGDATLAKALKDRTAGVWHYRCCRFGDSLIPYEYFDTF